MRVRFCRYPPRRLPIEYQGTARIPASFCKTLQLCHALFEHEVTLAAYGLAKILLDQVSEAERAIGFERHPRLGI